MPDPEPDNAEYKERNEKLLHLIAKKENSASKSQSEVIRLCELSILYNKNQVTIYSCKILPTRQICS